jgi:hypothetical protein
LSGTLDGKTNYETGRQNSLQTELQSSGGSSICMTSALDDTAQRSPPIAEKLYDTALPLRRVNNSVLRHQRRQDSSSIK